MTRPLLDRQSRLLEYLTSRAAIFGGEGGTAVHSSLQGIDRGLLGIEARFSHEKRMEKITAAFPLTFDLLADERDKTVRAFVEACPPRDIGRIENARQFHDFLYERWKREPPAFPHLPDVVSCELACATVRLTTCAEPEAALSNPPRPAIRRRAGLVLLHTAFDICCLFENDADAAPPERETWLAIMLVSGEPQILELARETFDLLAVLDNWTKFDEQPGADDFLAELVEAGVLELRH